MKDSEVLSRACPEKGSTAEEGSRAQVLGTAEETEVIQPGGMKAQR